jgi:diguanylate cyclase (GGDEF)-like protein/PAS domain S-box-containing protein
MKNAPCGFVVLTDQGEIQEANDTFLNMIGYRKEDLMHKHLESFLSIPSRLMFHSLFFPQIRLNGRIEELYITISSKNGPIPVLLMGSKHQLRDREVIDCMMIRMSRRDNYEKELKFIKQELEDAYLAENKLRKLFETTLFSINEGIIVTDGAGMITIMNPLAEKFTGWKKESAQGKAFDEVFLSVTSKTREKQSDMVLHVIETGTNKDVFDDLILISRDGTERFVSGTAAAILSENGSVSGVISSFRDITKEYLQEKEIDHFLNVNLEMLCVMNGSGEFHKINKKFGDTLGYSAEELLGKSFLKFVHEEDVADTSDVIMPRAFNHEPQAFTNRFRCKDGSYKYIEWYRQPVEGRFVYSSARDVTEKILKENKLMNIAVKDELTGLYNRHFLISYLEEETQAEKENQPMSMAIMDLDHFKLVNDTWGHPVGDAQLKHTAGTILNAVRKTDLLIRFGGEEFLLILPRTSAETSANVLEKVRVSVETNHHPVTGRQTVSIGIAEYRNGESFTEWYQRADGALYRAKKAGRNRIIVADE